MNNKLSILTPEEIKYYLHKYLKTYDEASTEELIMYISEIGNQKLEKILEKMIKKGKIKTIIIKDEIYYYALEYDSAIQTFLQDHPSATVEELEDFMKKLQKEQGEEVI